MAKLHSQERKQYMRENYNRLREAGFSSKEAARLKNASIEKVNQAISSKTLPEISERHQTRARVKWEDKEYKASKSRELELKNQGDKYIGNVVNRIHDFDKEGYNYYSIRIEYKLKTGETIVKQTPMDSTRNIKDKQDLYDALTDATADFDEAYGFDATNATITLVFWSAL